MDELETQNEKRMSVVDESHYLDAMRDAYIELGSKYHSFISDRRYRSGDFILIRGIDGISKTRITGDHPDSDDMDIDLSYFRSRVKTMVANSPDGKELIIQLDEKVCDVPCLDLESGMEGYNFASINDYIELFGKLESGDTNGTKIRLLGVGLGRPTISFDPDDCNSEVEEHYIMCFYLTKDGQDFSELPVTSRDGKIPLEIHDKMIPLKDREYVCNQLRNLRT